MHIDDMLNRFSMQNCKPARTPLPHKAVLGPRGPDEQSLPPRTPYRSLIRSLLYVATWTRPDIALLCPKLPASKQTRVFIIGIWRTYLALLARYAGTFAPGSAAATVSGYDDASWGEDPSTRKSQSGYVFTLANAAIQSMEEQTANYSGTVFY